MHIATVLIIDSLENVLLSYDSANIQQQKALVKSFC